jgi:hypothetical protein
MKKLTALIGLTLITTAPLAYAEVSDEEFQKMQQMLEQALQRIDELERREAVVDTVQQAETGAVAGAEVATAEQVATNTAKLEKMSWAERIRIQGDFRYRYQAGEGKKLIENVADDGDPADYQPVPDATRNRQRIRGRFAVIGDLPGNVEVGLGLATGGDDPVSSNQTLGGSGSSKDIKLDLAYFDWMFVEDAYLTGGKFKNEFYRPFKNGLMFDSDWRPEGFQARYEGELFYASGMTTWLEADSKNSGSDMSYGMQAGFTPEFSNVGLNLGASYWKIKADGVDCYDAPSNTGGNGADRGCFGNTAADFTVAPPELVAGGSDAFYVMDYAPAEVYGELNFKTSVPFGFFAEYITNLDAKTIPVGPSAGQKLDTAYAAGASIGKGKKAKEWQLKLIYQDMDADAVLGLLSDSDFAGGGTDSKGYVLRGKYMLTDRTNLAMAYFRTERKDSNGVENGDPDTPNPFDINTLQLDVQFKTK